MDIELARTYMNEANALGFKYQGDAAAAYLKIRMKEERENQKAAVDLYHKAIEIYEQLVNKEGHSELSNELAIAYTKKAMVLTKGDFSIHAAEDLYLKAFSILYRLVNEEGHSELSNELATAYINLADEKLDVSWGTSMTLYDKAIQIYERLVSEESRSDLEDELAKANMKEAHCFMWSQFRLKDAMYCYNKAIQILDRLVNQEGRSELESLFKLACDYKSIALKSTSSGDYMINKAVIESSYRLREWAAFWSQKNKGV